MLSTPVINSNRSLIIAGEASSTNRTYLDGSQSPRRYVLDFSILFYLTAQEISTDHLGTEARLYGAAWNGIRGLSIRIRNQFNADRYQSNQYK